MSEHAHKAHPAPAIVLIVVIAALLTWGVAIMNPDYLVGSLIAGALLVVFGCFTVLVLGRE